MRLPGGKRCGGKSAARAPATVVATVVDTHPRVFGSARAVVDFGHFEACILDVDNLTAASGTSSKDTWGQPSSC